MCEGDKNESVVMLVMKFEIHRSEYHFNARNVYNLKNILFVMVVELEPTVY